MTEDEALKQYQHLLDEGYANECNVYMCKVIKSESPN